MSSNLNSGSVDDDQSGFLDLREATTALKQWQKMGKDKYMEQSDKTRQLAALKSKAGRALQDALRTPEQIKPPGFSTPARPSGGSSSPPSSPQQPSSGGAASAAATSSGWRTPLKGAAEGLGNMMSSRRSPEKQAADEAAKLQAQEAAKRALKFLTNQRLIKGWNTWQSFLHQTAYTRRLLVRTLQILQHFDQARGYRKWLEWYGQRTRLVYTLDSAIRRLLHLEESRMWSTWAQAAREGKAAAERASRRRKVMARLKHPELNRAFRRWCVEAGLGHIATRLGVGRAGLLAQSNPESCVLL